MGQITAKKLGFKKGDFVFTGAFPGIVVGNVNSYAPLIEVWGFEHETGSAYTSDLRLLSGDDFCVAISRLGFGDPKPYCKEAKAAIDKYTIEFHERLFPKNEVIENEDRN